jgi:hypothetical protein
LSRIDKCLVSYSFNGAVVQVTLIDDEFHIKRGDLDFSMKQLKDDIPDPYINIEIATLSLFESMSLFKEEMKEVDIEVEVRLGPTSLMSVKRILPKDGLDLYKKPSFTSDLRSKIEGQKTSVKTTQYTSSDGKEFIEKQVEMKWVLGSPSIRPMYFAYIYPLVQEARRYLTSKSEDDTYTNMEVLELRAVGQDKDKITSMKMKVEDQLRSYEKKITEKILSKTDFSRFEKYLGVDVPVMGLVVVDTDSNEVATLIDEEKRSESYKKRVDAKSRIIGRVVDIDKSAPLIDRGGVAGFALARLRMLLGRQFLSPKYVRDAVDKHRGYTPAHTCERLAKTYVKDYISVRRLAVAIISHALGELDVEIDRIRDMDSEWKSELLITSAFYWSLLNKMKDEMNHSLDPIAFVGNLFYKELRR